MSTDITLNETMYVGPTITSHDPSRNAEARLSQVSTTGNVDPAGPFTESHDARLQLPSSPDTGNRDVHPPGGVAGFLH